MSKKRRDSRNRILREGESQRKDGRYAYKYLDDFGDAHFVYSWKLEKTDKLPAGKKDCVSLREKIKEIEKRKEQGLVAYGVNVKVSEGLKKYYDTLKGMVRVSTYVQYGYELDILLKDKISNMPAKDVTRFMAEEWIRENGKKYSSVRVQQNKMFLESAFDIFVKSKVVLENPFSFKIGKVLRLKRHSNTALTEAERDKFLEYLRTSKYSKHYDAIYTLLYTGLRISELVGLTTDDIDFDNNCIIVSHQALYVPGDGFKVRDVKSEAGNRKIPMILDVREIMERKVAAALERNSVHDVGEYGKFLFVGLRGTPIRASSWGWILKKIKDDYMANGGEFGGKNVTLHTFRHTFCSTLLAEGINLKHLQYLMGHSKIDMTLNIYSHVNYENIEEELRSMQMFL